MLRSWKAMGSRMESYFVPVRCEFLPKSNLKNHMKIKSITLILFVCFVSSLHAQDKSDVFNKSTKITWLGLDFSGAKFLGDRERLGSESDIRHLIEGWNEL